MELEIHKGNEEWYKKKLSKAEIKEWFIREYQAICNIRELLEKGYLKNILEVENYKAMCEEETASDNAYDATLNFRRVSATNSAQILLKKGVLRTTLEGEHYRALSVNSNLTEAEILAEIKSYRTEEEGRKKYASSRGKEPNHGCAKRKLPPEGSRIEGRPHHVRQQSQPEV